MGEEIEYWFLVERSSCWKIFKNRLCINVVVIIILKIITHNNRSWTRPIYSENKTWNFGVWSVAEERGGRFEHQCPTDTTYPRKRTNEYPDDALWIFFILRWQFITIIPRYNTHTHTHTFAYYYYYTFWYNLYRSCPGEICFTFLRRTHATVRTYYIAYDVRVHIHSHAHTRGIVFLAYNVMRMCVNISSHDG